VRAYLVPVVVLAALAGCSAATPPAPKPSGSEAPGCPVDVPTLEQAFKASAKVADNFVLGKGLKDPSCYSGYATAVTQPTNMDPAVILFRFDPAQNGWAAVIGGIDICHLAVPEWISTRLDNCS